MGELVSPDRSLRAAAPKRRGDGLGRTGTVAARMLVGFGMDAGSAIAVVRRVGPGAIETHEQEMHVRRCHPIVEA